jgi:hypothetical protein
MKKTKLGIISTTVFAAGVATGVLIPAKNVKVLYQNQVRHDLETSQKVKDIIGDQSKCTRIIAENGQGKPIHLAACGDIVLGEAETIAIDNLLPNGLVPWSDFSFELVENGKGEQKLQAVVNYSGYVDDKVGNLEVGKQAIIVP